MGLDVMKIGVSIRKGLIFSIRTSYRSVRDHPFYWAVVFFFFFLYRLFPSLLGLLVSCSPVLVCTAALLGTLLSFGNPNIPEIEKDDKRTHEAAALKVAVVENDLVVQKDESLSAEVHLEKRREVEEKVEEEPRGLEEGSEANVSKVDENMVLSRIIDNGLMGRTIANEELPKEILGEKQMIKEEGEFGEVELGEERDFHEEDSLIGAAPCASKDIDGTTSVGWEEIETPRRKIDLPSGAFSITHELPWKPVEGHSKSSDSDSDHTESTSPDASMTDIMPMLDELHPLLESEASQPPLITLGNSNTVSESSNRTHDGSAESEEEGAESEEEGENQEEEDDDAEEQAQGTTWTEDDQKNLMDLGTLELERNRRLESLIAKRRARNLMRMESIEKNLIDLDSNDSLFSITPILTRRNPFELPYDSYEAMGLPPIPGSAPSTLLPRRNPFDLPYEPYEEKPNLMDDSFQQEFTPFHPKDLQFRRYESFNLRVSADSKQRRHFRPYFVTERMASEGTEYSMFQRQLSEKSESKVSSVPETESASSVADQEDHKSLAEQELSQEVDLISFIDHAPDNVSQSSKLVDLMEIYPEEKRDVKFDGIAIKGVNEEGRPMHVDCSSDHVEHESHSSGELDSAEVYPEEGGDLDVDGVNLIGVDEETSHEVELLWHHSRSVPSLVEPNNSEFHAVAENDSDSSSSSSELHEKLFHMDTDGGSRDLELKRDDNTEGSSVSIRSSLTESDFSLRNWITEGGDESQTKEPVYDSSPSKIEKTLSKMTSIEEAFFYVDKGVVTSTPSIASDLQVEVSGFGSPPFLVDRQDGESLYYKGSTKEISPGNEGTWVTSPNLCAIDESELRSMEGTEISEPNVEVGFSAVSRDFDGPNVPKRVVGEAELGELCLISEEVHLQSKQDQVSLPSFNAEVQQHDANMKVDTMAYSYSKAVSSEDSGSSEMEKSTPLMEEFTVHPSSDGDHKETQDPFVLLVQSIGEANVQALENEFSNLTAPVPIPIPSEVSEIKSTSVLTDIKDNIHVGVQSGDESRVLENHSDSELPVLEARTLEDIDMAFKQFDGGDGKPMVIESLRDKPTMEETEFGVGESGKSDGGSKSTEISSELSVLEVKSVEDVDLAFMKLHGGELEKTILPESVDDRLPVVESHYVKEIDPDLPVDEVRTLEGFEVEEKEMEHSKKLA
ncbi:hypothetical protein NE237_005044 [Protea cynaroides]|uniref:Uncharacterized protein n=1 Tax=Protea cynaroides TaxID=273540 RepID=A0A9Q0KK56_9MAGN|nr:hypothetical protein NE237_005044 [Protea cynaroides]